MPLYESTFIVRHDVSVNEVEKLTANYSKIITDNGGQVTYSEYWGLRNLSYIINKSKKGHYVMLCLDASSEAINEMERLMRLNEDILRNATFKVEELLTGPSYMMGNANDDVETVTEELEVIAVEEEIVGDN